MNHEYLETMRQGIEAYLKDTGISQSVFAKKADVSPSYVTHAIKGNWDAVPAGKNPDGSIRTSPFSETAAKKIMQFLGMEELVWDIDNYHKCTITLFEAKKYAEHRIISGDKGTGKTTSSLLFLKKHPSNTFYIKVADDMTPSEFIRELAKQVGANPEGSRRRVRLSAENRLKELNNPLLIIDEAENAKNPTMAAIKALYDGVHNNCGITMVGANRFYEKIEKWANRGTGCYPQLFSRFSSSPALLLPKTWEETKKICKYYGIEDAATMRILHDKSSDFRELDRNIKRYLRDNELAKPTNND